MSYKGVHCCHKQEIVKGMSAYLAHEVHVSVTMMKEVPNACISVDQHLNHMILYLKQMHTGHQHED